MEVLERISFSSLLNRSDVQALLRALLDGSISVLKPVLNQSGDFSYPEAEKIMGSSSRVVREILEALSEESILLKDIFVLTIACPYCGDNRLVVELACPHCDSTRLKIGATIEHLECGYIGFEEDVKNMVCPKCDKRIRALGIDYRKPGIMYRCLSCKEFTGSPRRKYTCLKEKHVFYEDEGVSKEVCSYGLNPEKKDLIGKWIMDLNPVAEALMAKGLLIKTPAKIRGRSGVEHTFSLFASGNNGNNIILVDVLINDKPIDESALSLIFKALDVDASRRVMVFVPGLTEKARALFDYYKVLPNMNIIECKNINEINNMVLDVLDNFIEVSPQIM
ncbi:MAG: hypothetical protein FGF52_03640 [Candidatus Brockarchaeota archaeon]|nr:hypothetical protein [Candidatus Brockarchaeota archaeon]